MHQDSVLYMYSSELTQCALQGLETANSPYIIREAPKYAFQNMSFSSPRVLQGGLIKNDSSPVFTRSGFENSMVVSQRGSKISKTRAEFEQNAKPSADEIQISSNDNIFDIDDEKSVATTTFTLPEPQNSVNLPHPHPSLSTNAMLASVHESADSASIADSIERKPGLYDSMLCSDVQKMDAEIEARMTKRSPLLVSVPSQIGEEKSSAPHVFSPQPEKTNSCVTKEIARKSRPTETKTCTKSTRRRETCEPSDNSSIRTQKQNAVEDKSTTQSNKEAERQASSYLKFSAENFAEEALVAQMYETELVILKLRKERLVRQRAFRLISGKIGRRILHRISENNRLRAQNELVSQCNAITERLDQCLALKQLNEYPVVYLVDKINAISDAMQLQANEQLENAKIGDPEVAIQLCASIEESLSRLESLNHRNDDNIEDCVDINGLLRRCQEMEWQLASVVNV